MVRASKQSSPATAPEALDCARRVLDVVPTVMDALRGAVRAQVGEPLSVPQFRALGFVARHAGCTVSELAAFLGVTMPTASALVDRLARAGLLSHDEHPADRRRLRLELTANGSRLLAEIAGGAHRELAERLAHCSATELRTLRDGLTVMRRLAGRDSRLPAVQAPVPLSEHRTRVRRT